MMENRSLGLTYGELTVLRKKLVSGQQPLNKQERVWLNNFIRGSMFAHPGWFSTWIVIGSVPNAEEDE
jgi:hypothetical protein